MNGGVSDQVIKSLGDWVGGQVIGWVDMWKLIRWSGDQMGGQVISRMGDQVIDQVVRISHSVSVSCRGSAPALAAAWLQSTTSGSTTSCSEWFGPPVTPSPGSEVTTSR